jgi:glycosyltransferase involved in cell wall biosynthesis
VTRVVGDPGGADPWFSATTTVRNNAPTIGPCLDSILPQLAGGGELVVVDAESSDGTWTVLIDRARSDPRLRPIQEPGNRGVGRNRAAELARGSILLTNLDGDNVYAPGVLAGAARRLRDARPPIDLILVIGAQDPDPSSGRFFVWQHASFTRIGGYPARQGLEDPEAVLRAFRAGARVDRWIVDHVARDLKPRRPGQAPSVPPWRRRRHAVRAARKFRIIGFRYPEFVRYLWLTRRTSARFLAGCLLAALAYVEAAASGNSVDFLTEDEEDAHVVRELAAERKAARTP